MKNFLQRTISALILGPLFLYVCYLGGDYLFFTAVGLFIVMYYEWFTITSKTPQKGLWWIFGFLYLAFACMVLVFLGNMRFYPDTVIYGLTNPPILLFAAIILVWVNDIFGYIFGKTIGGPKLCPKISPGKTWAGAIGGVIGSLLIFFILNYGTSFGANNVSDKSFYMGMAIHIFVPIVAQIGDLFESYIKRIGGVKDSSNLIPGHGGFLDRFDGLILVLNVVGILVYIALYEQVAARIY
jgi:phosphatidate cytidylyltransferase